MATADMLAADTVVSTGDASELWIVTSRTGLIEGRSWESDRE